MRIISYNMNGIRSAIQKGVLDWLEKENPDVLCIQETKAQPDQIDVESFAKAGYPHSIIHSAQKKGYSGVALFSKVKPDYFSFGLGNDFFDAEGRLIRADFGDLTVICVYIPSGTTGDIRQAHKMDFLKIYSDFLKELKKTRKNLICCGDYNICHKAIDINHPERHTKTSGFLPEERAWFDQLVADGFVDSFREFNPKPEQYSWWSYRSNAREKNIGWRIDYHMVTEELRTRLEGARIHSEAVHSDHCPVEVIVKD